MNLYRYGGYKEASVEGLFEKISSHKNRKERKRIKKTCRRKGRNYLKKIKKKEISQFYSEKKECI